MEVAAVDQYQKQNGSRTDSKEKSPHYYLILLIKEDSDYRFTV
jgi:hypothetical protein